MDPLKQTPYVASTIEHGAAVHHLGRTPDRRTTQGYRLYPAELTPYVECPGSERILLREDGCARVVRTISLPKGEGISSFLDCLHRAASRLRDVRVSVTESERLCDCCDYSTASEFQVVGWLNVPARLRKLMNDFGGS